jgi:hypothetical protein
VKEGLPVLLKSILLSLKLAFTFTDSNVVFRQALCCAVCRRCGVCRVCGVAGRIEAALVPLKATEIASSAVRNMGDGSILIGSAVLQEK